jgi:GNAT superfamily N-acetyltransferase
MNIDINASGKEDIEYRNWLLDQLKAHNNVHSPWHRAAREEGYIIYLDLRLSREDGTVVGGLTARLYWGVMYIDDLFVPEDLRGKGLGSRLLMQAEDAACRKGCKRSILDTFSFQAPEFYKKHGYRIIGEIPDYPPGESMLRLLKHI